MFDPPLSRQAGPLALAAGTLIIVAQLLWLPFDPDDHVATATDPVFQTGNVIYLVGFCVLMLALVGAYGWGLHKAPGRLGVIAFVTAIVGTMLLGGDLWFETFVISWIANDAPDLLNADDPSTRVFPSAICVPVGDSNARNPMTPPIAMATQMAAGKTRARKFAIPNRSQPTAKSR